MVMKTTALIYGTPEQKQQVVIDFEGYPVRKWFDDEETFFCNSLKVLDSLNFRPSDINQDLTIAIADAVGMEPNDIRIDVDVKFTVKPLAVIQIKTEYETPEMLFI
jgi:hypothetical protein